MTAKSVNGSGNGARSGAQALLLLATPLNVLLLRALEIGPKQQTELRRETGFPAQSTLRAQLKRLGAVGAIEKSRRDRFPGALEYDLTSAGRDLLFVALTLERWLIDAPDGPLSLGDNAAKAAISALAAGWSTAIVRVLAAESLSLTELDSVISGLSYPALERRLASMRLAGLIAPCTSNGRRTPYAVTGWLQRGAAPLAAAIRWEQLHLSHASAPLGRLDVEAAFLLSLPLLRLPEELSGSCRMAAEVSSSEAKLAGVVVDVRRGRVVSCATRLQGTAEAWALGPSPAWLAAVIDNEVDRLELGGDFTLARSLVMNLHQVLFDTTAEVP